MPVEIDSKGCHGDGLPSLKSGLILSVGFQTGSHARSSCNGVDRSQRVAQLLNHFILTDLSQKILT